MQTRCCPTQAYLQDEGHGHVLAHAASPVVVLAHVGVHVTLSFECERSVNSQRGSGGSGGSEGIRGDQVDQVDHHGLDWLRQQAKAQ